jgi:RNase adaptor protein for sRNA GlmZ degradation
MVAAIFARWMGCRNGATTACGAKRDPARLCRQIAEQRKGIVDLARVPEFRIVDGHVAHPHRFDAELLSALHEDRRIDLGRNAERSAIASGAGQALGTEVVVDRKCTPNVIWLRTMRSSAGIDASCCADYRLVSA